jgi:hypothetical protein
MTKKSRRKKTRKKQEKVVTQFHPVLISEWADICGLPWTRAERLLVGALFIGEGVAKAEAACEGAWSRVMQVNRRLVRHQVPLRIRGYELPKEMWTGTTYQIQRLGVRLEKIV